MNKIILAFAFLLLPAAAFAQNKSVYTSLDTKDCKTVEQSSEGAGWYRGECKGVGGFKLEVTEGDLRQSINVISPSGDKFELDFTQVSGRFSTVGQKAEWRVNKNTPVALIVRFNFNSEGDDTGTKNTSYLIVSKISKTAACITDVVKPSKTQNAEAQKLADQAAKKPCKTFE
jgi:hypothetical protein